MYEEIIDKIKEYQVIMAEVSLKLSKGLKLYSKNLIPYEEKLKNSGWTMGMNLAPYHVVEIGEKISAGQVDEYFYNLYMSYDCEEFNRMIEEIRRNLESRLIKAFDECVYAFEHQKYVICINTLIPILEGIISEFFYDKNNIMMKKVCRVQLERSNNNEFNLDRIAWSINLNFIERLYLKSEFDKDEPLNINRHWLLHGRSSYDINIIDCLKIINAIDTFSCLLEFQKDHYNMVESEKGQ